MPNDELFEQTSPSPNSSSSSSTASSATSTNLKVPPIKIIFNQNQSNAVINSTDDFVTKPSDELTGGSPEEPIYKNPQIIEDVSNKGSLGKKSRNGTEHQESETDNSMSVRTDLSTSNSSSSNTSDRSSSTSPSSESESLASNSTIISDNPQRHQSQLTKVKLEAKDENSSAKLDKSVRNVGKISTDCRAARRPAHDSGSDCGEQVCSASNSTIPSTSKEPHTSGSNQRITRSSQRAAQQNKNVDVTADHSTNEEPLTQEIQEKAPESTRKVKRRKGEPQEPEQDINQSSNQTSLYIANIYPSDYQLPPQNSFQLYKTLRSKPHKKLWNLSHAPPKAPHGFKNYLLTGGPYLLDGNKLGSGVIGSILENCDQPQNQTARVARQPLTDRVSVAKYKTINHRSFQQRHTEYPIPQLSQPPKSLPAGSPLHELFVDQERARHQMRMQHVKERERSVLAIEQEVLRAYNRAAIADMRQDSHLSACTYFYYQERYHYNDEKLDSSENPTQQNSSQSNGFSDNQTSSVCETTNTVGRANNEGNNDKESPVNQNTDHNVDMSDDSKDVKTNSEQDGEKSSNNEKQQISKFSDREKMVSNPSELKVMENSSHYFVRDISVNGLNCDKTGKSSEICDDQANGSESANSKNKSTTLQCETIAHNSVKTEDHINKSDVSMATTIEDPDASQTDLSKRATVNRQGINTNTIMSDEDLKVFNRNIFIKQLQDIDDKWELIKNDMCIRHRNEADSLYAIQSLEWEWRAKEVGLADSRCTYMVDPAFVPRIEVKQMDY